MLTDVPVINQKDFFNICKASIRGGSNVLISGPSGSGKTFIAQQAAESEQCNLIYINLSVLERTDFQGFPVISDDKKLVSYATPEFLPFVDTKLRDEKIAMTNFLNSLDKSKQNEKIISWTQDKIEEIKKQEQNETIINSAPYITANAIGNKEVLNRFKTLFDNAKKNVKEELPIVILFDEVDKALTETTQTLLELLQFTSINSRKLNIKSCILTGNLPDEHAHSNQISHAIAKRCQSYKLEPEFEIWREWAYANNVHDYIIQYLTIKPEELFKEAPEDATAYALPSPRTWTAAGEALSNLEKDPYFKNMRDDKLKEFKRKIIAGNVGDTATINFYNWLDYYKKLDPVIEKLMNQGEHPKGEFSDQEILIMAISGSSKVFTELKAGNEKRINKITKNVYEWIGTLQSDVQMASARLGFGSNWKKCIDFNLHLIPEFLNVFKAIQNELNEYDSDFG